MKKWNSPEVVALDMECTEYGTKLSTNYDDVRVDQNGRYWYSFSCGSEGPIPTGEVIKVEQQHN